MPSTYLAEVEAVARRIIGACIGCGASKCPGCWNPPTRETVQLPARPARPAAPRHGTVRRYRWGCRCRRCRKANTERHQNLRQARRWAGEADPSLIPHGGSGYTNWACRCDVCKAAQAQKNRRGGLARRSRKQTESPDPTTEEGPQ